MILRIRNLKETIAKRGMTHADVYRKMTAICEKEGLNGVGRVGLWHWIKGNSFPPGNKVYILAAVLKCHPKKLVEVSFDQDKINYFKSLT